MSYLGKNPTFQTLILGDQGVNTVTAPPAGYIRLLQRYGNVYKQNSSSIESALGGGGGGNLNQIANPSDATNWISSAATAAATTTTAAELPLGPNLITSAIKLTRTTAASYDAVRWVQPVGLDYQVIPISWYQLVESGFVAGDFKLELYVNSASNYGGTFTRKSLRSDVSGVTQIPAGSGNFGAGNVVSYDSSNDRYYELRIIRVSGTKYLTLAQVFAGPGTLGQGASISDWLIYPSGPTISGFGTVSGVSFSYEVMGPNLEITGTWVNGTPTAALASIPLPTGYTARTSVIGTNVYNVVGEWSRAFATASNPKKGTVIMNTTTSNVLMYFGLGDYTPAISPLVPQNGNTLVAGTEAMTFKARVPINESAPVLNFGLGSVVEYAYNSSAWSDASDTTSFGYGPAGVAIGAVDLTTQRTRRVQFQTPIQATDQFQPEIQINGKWVPALGAFIPTTGFPIQAFAYGASGSATTTYGIGWQPVSGSNYQVDVYFGRFGNSYNGNATTQGWSAIIGAQTVLWRLKKFSAAVPVAQDVAKSGFSGLINYYQDDDTTLAACTFQGNLGGAASAGIAIRITRIGRMVTLDIPALTTVVPTASSTAIFGNTFLPTWARPPAGKSAPTFAYDNGNFISGAPGQLSINSTGRIEFYKTIAGSAYTNSANAGWNAVSISYFV